MEERTVSLADAKAHLSELTELVAAGETVIITKRGKPIARVTRPEQPRQAIDLNLLRKLTSEMQPQEEEAGAFMRRVRNEARY